MRKGAARWAGTGEPARLSGEAGALRGGRDDVGRREEPPSDESGVRAHGSNQRFHRLVRHAVARALTTAPSLAGVSPAAEDILILHGWRRKGRQGRCRTKGSGQRHGRRDRGAGARHPRPVAPRRQDRRQPAGGDRYATADHQVARAVRAKCGPKHDRSLTWLSRYARIFGPTHGRRPRPDLSG